MNPVIKWSGSKNRQAKWLHKQEPPKQKRFFSPFVGGGAMLQFRTNQEGVVGDTICPVIDLWRMIRDYPNLVSIDYRTNWRYFQKDPEYYYKVRGRFNEEKNPLDFLFLTRTCAGGLIRFNSSREFNSPVHHGRPGIHPNKLSKLISRWAKVIANISFYCQDYKETLEAVEPRDFVFLDPPYKRTKGMYLPEDFDYNEFYTQLERLNRVGANWMLTLDGITHKGEVDDGIPKELYKRKLKSKKTNSTFVKLKNMDQGHKVSDFIFMNY